MLVAVDGRFNDGGLVLLLLESECVRSTEERAGFRGGRGGRKGDEGLAGVMDLDGVVGGVAEVANVPEDIFGIEIGEEVDLATGGRVNNLGGTLCASE